MSHPGPGEVVLPHAIADAIAAQARAEHPNEACGLIVGSAPAEQGGIALRYEACRNEAASPDEYEIDPDDVSRILIEADDADLVVWAIVHSHVRSPAEPSATDIERAIWWPDQLYLLVSLADDQADPVTGAPSLRAWRILDGVIDEVVLEVN